MPPTPISDAELALVACVAGRERWSDLSSPPDVHPPRTIEEELAVARFAAAVPRRRDPRSARVKARLAMAAVAVAVLGACWWVSPTRTALALIVAGLVSAVAMRRSRRREGRRPRLSGRVGAR